MNVSKTNTALGISFLASDRPTDYAALADAIATFYSELGTTPNGIVILLESGKIAHRAYRPNSLRKALCDPKSLMLFAGDVTKPNEVIVECFLRPRDPARQEFLERWIAVTSTALSIDAEPVPAFLAAVARLYPVVQGGIGRYRALPYATKEASLSGAFSSLDLDEDTRARLKEDAMLSGGFLRKLRRLYPVTIIGPEIWAQLPPMPKVDPPPKIEDLGDCKMLTVWPELVEPRDPSFLAGTTELRRWLWPFTIQNPADAIDG